MKRLQHSCMNLVSLESLTIHYIFFINVSLKKNQVFHLFLFRCMSQVKLYLSCLYQNWYFVWKISELFLFCIRWIEWLSDPHLNNQCATIVLFVEYDFFLPCVSFNGSLSVQRCLKFPAATSMQKLLGSKADKQSKVLLVPFISVLININSHVGM